MLDFLMFLAVFFLGVVFTSVVSGIRQIQRDKNFIRGTYHLLRNQDILYVGIVCTPGQSFSGTDANGNPTPGSITQHVEYTINHSKCFYASRDAFQIFFNENVIENLSEVEAKRRLKDIRDALATI